MSLVLQALLLVSREELGPGGPSFETGWERDFSKALSGHPTENGYLALFRPGEGEGSKEEH